ncbi:WD40/YVTN/BNR-like repeat-containing protein [Marinobacter confluentis]|uniref:Glycosyl hydrolase n=1 Tax=Marinobacter confluentis TaxID=1697557 RepID=A0A4Z1BSD7_9GAMM|nr:glycosyl hydrolase [Marinobacter confluentis]TGN40139.1 glycosyl hydrolase [Marinobacter confluentis]
MVGKVLGFAAQIAPWAVVSGLAYAAAFIKPTVEPLPLPQPLSEPRDLFYDVAGSPQSSVWFAGNNGVILERNGADDSWVRHSMERAINLQGIATSDTGLVVAVGNQGWLFRNDGSGWESQQLPVSEIAGKLIEVAWLDGHFWAIGEMGAVFRGSADGQNWTDLSLDGDVAMNDIARSSDGRLWVTAEFGTLYQSTDNGQSWQGEELGYESLRSLAFNDDQGVIVGNGGVVYLSMNGGESWQRHQSGTEEHLYDVIYDGERWLATGNGGALISSDNGAKWSDIQPDGFASGYHARLMATEESVLLAGSTIGRLSGERWTQWPEGGE